jgi:hypothetical protein
VPAPSPAGDSALSGVASAAIVGLSRPLLSAPPVPVAGAPFSVPVTAGDANGKVAFGYTGTAPVKDPAGSAALPADYTFTTGPGSDNGAHTFAGLVLNGKVKPALQVADTLDSSISGSVTETPV